MSLIRGDIRDPTRSRSNGGDGCRHTWHTSTTACAENPRGAFEVMRGGSFNVVEAARDAGVARIVTASSARYTAWRSPSRPRRSITRTATDLQRHEDLLEGLLRSFY